MKTVLKKINSKAGITLVEVIVGMVLMSIIMTAVSTVLTPILKTIIRANELAELNNLVNNVSLEIINDLSEATKVTPIGDGINISKNGQEGTYQIIEYTVNSEGFLKRNGELVLSERHYKGKSIRITYTDDTEGGISDETTKFLVTVSVYEGDGADKTIIIEREYAVKPLALNQYNP